MFPTSDEHHVISAREFVGLGKQQGKTGERGPGHLRGVSKLAEPRLDGCADAQQLEALERHDFSGGTSRQEPRATVVAAVGSGRAHQGQQHVPQHPGAHTHTPTHTQPTRPPPHPLPQLARSYDDIPNPEVVDTMPPPHDNRTRRVLELDFRVFTNFDDLTKDPDADYVDPSDLANAVRIMSPSLPSPSGLANAVRNMSPSPLSQSPPPSMTLAMVLDGWTPPSTPVAVSVCGSPTA